ncbi:MAG TPA: hypothetical protein VHQ86_05070 [Candidatus Saccharimonadia bacterium]|nr:hypothetical protein [Candidatus Saccharimonadia bacterium]
MYPGRGPYGPRGWPGRNEYLTAEDLKGAGEALKGLAVMALTWLVGLFSRRSTWIFLGCVVGGLILLIMLVAVVFHGAHFGPSSDDVLKRHGS